MRDYSASELYHYGVLGQKWGVRRYQNEDGTLTRLGRLRYLDRHGNLTKKGRAKYVRDRETEITDRQTDTSFAVGDTVGRTVGTLGYVSLAMTSDALLGSLNNGARAAYYVLAYGGAATLTSETTATAIRAGQKVYNELKFEKFMRTNPEEYKKMLDEVDKLIAGKASK